MSDIDHPWSGLERAEAEAASEQFRAAEEAAKGLNGKAAGSRTVRFKFTQFRDIELGTAAPCVVDGMIPRLGVAVVWGKPKSGKTFWIYDLEMHVALGWHYRGRRVEQGAVLHIACEGVAGLAARTEAWRLHHTQGKNAEAIAQIEAAPFFLCKDTSLDLIRDVNSVATDILAQFGDMPIRIITIDTLNRSLKGSESRDEDMAAYIRAAVLLAEKFQCLVFVIHHCGYDATHPRGHTSLIGAVDADVEVKKEAKDAETRISTAVNNMRDGEDGAETYSRLLSVDVGRDDNGNPITSCVAVEAPAPAAEQKSKAKGPKLPSPMAIKFFEALTNAGAQLSEPRHESANRPSITEAQWIDELIRRGLVAPLPPGADIATARVARNRRIALLSKYRAELVASNWIACNGTVIWSVKRED
jgi:AAA domain